MKGAGEMNARSPESMERTGARWTVRAMVLTALVCLLVALLPNAAMAWPNPVLAGSASTGSGPVSVCVQGGYAYVVDTGSNTLQIFDVSNPASPSLAGSVATGSYPYSVCVQGGYAYVVNYLSNTLQVFNVSNPASPSLAGSVATGSGPYSVCVQGNYAYVVNNGSNTLQVFNVSNPASPSLAGSVATGSWPYSVCIQGGYAYVVNYSSNTLQVFNVSNPASPSLAGSTATGSYPYSVCVQGGYAYVVNWGSNTLQVFNVSNPASPSLAGSVATGSYPYSVCIQGGYAYVVNGGSTLQVFNVSNPASPSLAGSAATGSWPVSVCVQGSYAYVVNYSSSTLQVFNVSTTPTVTTAGFSNITSTTADSGGNVTDDGGATVTARGVCWNTTGSPTISDSHTTDGTGTGIFTSHITGLTPGTPYHVRAYATNSVGTSYGTQQDFTTLDVPTMTTGSATSITNTGATLNGNITATGGENADQRGFRYRKTGTSTWTTWTQAGSYSTGAFSHAISSLTPGVGYDFQSWAHNSAGTSCGSTKTFATATSPDSIWYLAEGSTAWGFSDYISIENPNTAAVHAAITYMTGSGNVSGGTIALPAQSQTTVNPADKLGAKDFSTKVVCTEGETIAVDRTMSWTGPGAASPEGHSSVGVTAPAKTWYLAEGSSAWNFECWLLIQNPNASAAKCTITYMIEGQGPKTVTKSVPANTRKTFNIADDIGQKDASIKVEGDIPVIPERAMYRNNRREGHDSIGTTSPATDFYLAEGTSAYGFTTYVLIQNPNSTPTDVTVTYMKGAGPKPQAPFSMAANSRMTIRVNDVLPNTDFSTKVHGAKPIIAERAMYWDNGTGEACHDSVGMDSAHTSFYLPDGQTSQGRETYTLVQNPNSSAVTVEITYMTPTGAGNVVFQDSIPGNSRKTYNMVDKGISGRAAIMVMSKTSGKKIMVERAMYWNSRGAGTDTIGGYSD